MFNVFLQNIQDTSKRLHTCSVWGVYNLKEELNVLS